MIEWNDNFINNGWPDDGEDIILTSISDASTVTSAFSESATEEVIDFELADSPKGIKRRPGRPKGSLNKKKKSKGIANGIDSNGNVGLLRVEQGKVDFFRACRNDSLTINIVKKVGDVNCQDLDGNTGLHLAVLNNSLNAIKLLIKRNEVDVERCNYLGERAIDLVKNNGNNDCRLLLREVCQMKEFCKENSDFSAIWRGDTEALVKSNISTATDAEGNGPLHYAAVANKVEAAKILLEDDNSSPLDDRLLEKKNNFDENALHFACRYDSEEMINFLLGKGVDYTALNDNDQTPIDLCSETMLRAVTKFAKEKKNAKLLAKVSLLTRKTLGTKTAIRERLTEASELDDLPNSTSVNDSGGYGHYSREERKLRQVLNLINKSTELEEPVGANVKNKNGAGKKRGRPPVHSAIVSDNDDDFNNVGSNGAMIASSSSSSPKKRDRSTGSASNSSSVSAVSNHNKKPKTDYPFTERSTGRTCLHRYAARGKLDRLKEALDHPKCTRQIINEADNAGYTALHEAALNGHADIVRLLLTERRGEVNVDAKAGNGDTPLHDAAENGHLGVVKLLLQFGADRGIVNKRKQTAFQVAENKQIAHLLEEAPLGGVVKSANSTKRSKSTAVSDDDDLSDAQTTLSPSNSGINNADKMPLRKSNSNRQRVAAHVLSTLFNSPKGLVQSEEPLLEILLAHDRHNGNGHSNNLEGLLVASQVEDLYAKSFPNAATTSSRRQLLLSKIPYSKVRHLSNAETQLLMEASILDKFPRLRKSIVSKPIVLVDRAAVWEEFDKAGGSLQDLPTIYVDLNNNNPHKVNAMSGGGKCTADDGDHLPPKLKMKFKQRRSVDDHSSRSN